MDTMIDEVAEKGEKERAKVEKEPRSEARKIEVAHHEPDSGSKKVRMKAEDVCAWFGTKQALFGVSMDIFEREVTAIIGPSGCGKSTLIPCFTPIHEPLPVSPFDGTISFD